MRCFRLFAKNLFELGVPPPNVKRLACLSGREPKTGDV
jgi:hypothetical protein